MSFFYFFLNSKFRFPGKEICRLNRKLCFSLSAIQVRNALKDFTPMLARHSPCVGTFSEIIYEAINASWHCLLFTKVKVQIANSKTGLGVVSRGPGDLPAFCHGDFCLFIH